ncbi:uncharacterized protein [Nicotiana tomentosiformis]|uniref:uncharacterized protein n=1 Tax=Nicotiana tomentosiformis TaxID=4098 RepID=UPI00388CA162
MADRSMKRPLGVIEDVLVQVDKFIILADFVIQDCEGDYEVIIILGRPFLATGKSLCAVEAEELTFWFGDEKVVFHLCMSMRKPNSNKVCSLLDLVTNVIDDDTSDTINVGDILEDVLLNFDNDDMDGFMECVNSLKGIVLYNYASRKLSSDLENRNTFPTKPSIEDPPTLELKPLPSHLCYEFFGPCSTLPVILSSCLTNVQIKLEDGPKPSIVHQRRLNEAMQEVVKKEIIKLAGQALYCFLDGYSGYNQILIAVEDQKKTTFTCPCGTFAFMRMPFGLCNALLLEKDAKFNFNDDCVRAFELLKLKFTTTPIITAPNWSVPFELMCDASDIAVRDYLGQRINKIFHLVYYASKTMNSFQVNYIVIVFEIEKFRPYLMSTKVIVHTGHATLHYLMRKEDSKARLMRWVLLWQEFDVDIQDRKGSDNEVADHLSHLEDEGRPHDGLEINDSFPYEQPLAILMKDVPWLADLANFLVHEIILNEFSSSQRKTLKRDCQDYY